MTTNGVLINERVVNILLDFRVDEISISLDSLDKDTFERLRTNASYEKAIRAIDLINRERSRLRTDVPRINLTPTFFRMNIRELPRFIDFANQHSIQTVQASPGQVYRESWVDESLLHYPDLTRKMVAKAERRVTPEGAKLINNLRMVYWNRGSKWRRVLRGEEDRHDFPTDPSECLKPWASLYIEPDGEVRPCCNLSPVYGNLFEKSFFELWNGEEAKRLRSQMLAKTPPRLCVNCYEFNRHKPDIMITLEEWTESAQRAGS
jgi:radical SAM protein with 4Fe4S-binding SPASM domain